MEDGIERKVLEELVKNLVMKKDELVRFLDGKVDNPESSLEMVMKNLIAKQLVTYVSPIGESCFAVTQKGMREVKV